MRTWGILVALALMILGGLLVQEYRRSLIVGYASSRFNLVMVDPEEGLTFVSIDPVEKTLVSLAFAKDAVMKSRENGEYDIGALYKLGTYQGNGGMFARQKVQGLMRVPIPAYIRVHRQKNVRTDLRRALWGSWKEGSTNLSLLDRWVVWRRSYYRYRAIESEELEREGVISTTGGRMTFQEERLRQYVGSRFFDWNLGGAGVTVAVVNASGKDGLGSDVADFLNNLGMDVVMVRTAEGDQVTEQSSWQVGSQNEQQELEYVFERLLQLQPANINEVPAEYRARVLLTVGKDAEELF